MYIILLEIDVISDTQESLMEMNVIALFTQLVIYSS